MKKTFSKEFLQNVVDIFHNTENKREAAKTLGVHYSTMYDYLARAREAGITEPLRRRRQEATPKKTPEEVAAKVKQELLRGKRSFEDLQRSSQVGEDEVSRALDELSSRGVRVVEDGGLYTIDKNPQPAYVVGQSDLSLKARPDGTFLFGVVGDKHVGSKYHREDVLADLYRRFEDAGVDAVFDTGNWIDGDARFNHHDLLVSGLDNQCQMLAEIHPKIEAPTYAVWGDDHEGWYAGREGIDVGKYNERIMREAGHNWTDLGFMEAHADLVTIDGDRVAKLAIVHPGGGSSYAISYSIQKIVESYEGGEKPAVGFYGHYHKMEAQNVRNVWTLQTGCTQDQTPFMRKKRLEAHVGGAIVKLEQDQETGAIVGFAPNMTRYFNRGFHSGRWSRHGAIRRSARTVNPGKIPSSSKGSKRSHA